MLKINKQKMYYSCKGDRKTVYDTDEDGNTVYVTVNGEQVPVVIGEEETEYSDPETFYANITNALSEATLQDFGVDDSGTYSQMVTNKGYLSLSEGDLIWKASDTSEKADYIVKGVATEGLTVDLYLLKRNV